MSKIMQKASKNKQNQPHKGLHHHRGGEGEAPTSPEELAKSCKKQAKRSKISPTRGPQGGPSGTHDHREGEGEAPMNHDHDPGGEGPGRTPRIY